MIFSSWGIYTEVIKILLAFFVGFCIEIVDVSLLLRFVCCNVSLSYGADVSIIALGLLCTRE